MSDELKLLPPLKWRGLEFPYADLKTGFAHDVAEHKKPDRDGGRLESTGRAPRLVSCRAIFRNRGTSLIANPYREDWFPGIFRKFEAMCASRLTGDLYHPVRGLMRCKVLSCDYTLTSDIRDGVDVEVSWKETTESDDTAAVSAPLARAYSAAGSLDAKLAILKQKLRSIKFEPEFTFTDALRKIQASANQVSLLSKRVFGSTDALMKRLDNVGDAIQDSADVTLAGAAIEVQRMRWAVAEYKKSQKEPDATALYLTLKQSTIPFIAATLKNTVPEILHLNPSLIGFVQVATRTVVRYYYRDDPNAL